MRKVFLWTFPKVKSENGEREKSLRRRRWLASRLAGWLAGYLEIALAQSDFNLHPAVTSPARHSFCSINSFLPSFYRPAMVAMRGTFSGRFRMALVTVLAVRGKNGTSVWRSKHASPADQFGKRRVFFRGAIQSLECSRCICASCTSGHRFL